MVELNSELVERQKLSTTKQNIILGLHSELENLFLEMRGVVGENEKPSDYSFELQQYAKIVESYEFLLQKAWGFSVDKDFHSWWFRVPYCTCPVIDNNERVGTKYSIMNMSCPIHGVKTEHITGDAFKKVYDVDNILEVEQDIYDFVNLKDLNSYGVEITARVIK